MKKTFRVVLIACLIGVCAGVMCGKKKVEKEKPIAALGGDTLTLEQFVKLSNDTSLNDVQIRRIMVLSSLAKKTPAPGDTIRFRKAVDEIAEQMSLRSDRQWTYQQVSPLLQASCALKRAVDTMETEGAVIRYIDSLFNQINMLCVQSQDAKDLLHTVKARIASKKNGKVTETEERLALTALVGHTFNLPPELSDMVAGYAFENESRRRETGELSDIIKGLVYDPSKDEMRRARRPELVGMKRDNSLLALSYRSRVSIMDSIGKHLPNLQALYKRQLKLHPTMSGTLAVSFRVDAGGRVMSAGIVRGNIREKDFIDPFLDYVKTIRFCQIPEKVGPMSFEFPFEFKAEE